MSDLTKESENTTSNFWMKAYGNQITYHGLEIFGSTKQKKDNRAQYNEQPLQVKPCIFFFPFFCLSPGMC